MKLHILTTVRLSPVLLAPLPYPDRPGPRHRRQADGPRRRPLEPLEDPRLQHPGAGRQAADARRLLVLHRAAAPGIPGAVRARAANAPRVEGQGGAWWNKIQLPLCVFSPEFFKFLALPVFREPVTNKLLPATLFTFTRRSAWLQGRVRCWPGWTPMARIPQARPAAASSQK